MTYVHVDRKGVII